MLTKHNEQKHSRTHTHTHMQVHSMSCRYFQTLNMSKKPDAAGLLKSYSSYFI